MYYRHNLNYTYPEKSDEHMITVKHIRDINFDETYNYLPKGFWWKFKRAVLWVLLQIIVFPLCTIRHGVKIHGRKNFKKHKKEFKNGAITVANHVLMWDYICVLKAIRPHLEYHPGWKTNFFGPNGPLIKWVGGIPIPTDSRKGLVKFSQALTEVVKSGKWMHSFAEGSMWFYYPDIRPLKKGIFKYAVRFNKPVIPITLSFRPAKGIAKLFYKKPLVDVNIGEPLYADKTLSDLDAIDKLHAETYHVMQVMNGINPGDPTYNTNQNIFEYKKTM